MSETVKLTQTIDDRDVVKAFQKQAALIDKIATKLDKVGKSGQTAGDRTAKGARGATTGIAKIGTALIAAGGAVVSITAAVGEFKKE